MKFLFIAILVTFSLPLFAQDRPEEDVSYYLENHLNSPQDFTPSHCQEPIENESEDSQVANSSLEHRAQIVVVVNKAPSCTSPDAQTMKIFRSGNLIHEFVISSASETILKPDLGAPYRSNTPTGFFRPQRVFKDYYSSSWGGARMQNAVFFAPGGVALHSTTPNHFHELGQRASGGCVRMWPEDSEIMNQLVISSGNPNWSPDIASNLQQLSVPGQPRLRNIKVKNAEVTVRTIDKQSGELATVGKKGRGTMQGFDTIIRITNERDPRYWTPSHRYTELGNECLEKLSTWQKEIKEKVKKGQEITAEDRSIPWR